MDQLGSWRNLENLRGAGGVGNRLVAEGNQVSSRALWELALRRFEDLDDLSGVVGWHGRVGQGERLCIGSFGVCKKRVEFAGVNVLV